MANAGGNVFYVMKEAVSRERLRELRIRITAEDALGSEDDPIEEAIPCWGITNAGVKKLADFGYDVGNIVETDKEGAQFVALANPDGTPASIEVDPSTIKVVQVDSTVNPTFIDVLTKLSEEILVSTFEKHVFLKTADGRACSRTTSDGDKYFEVIIWGSNVRGITEVPPEMWGNSVSFRDSSSVGPFLNGTAIVTDEGDEVGALTESILYIYHKADHTCNEGSQEILRRIFREAARIHQEGYKRDTEEIKARYVKACSARAHKEESRLMQEASSLKEQIAGYQKDLVKSLRLHQEYSHELDNFNSYKKELGQKLSKEFDNLLKVPKVRSVDWRGNCMTVETDLLHVIHPETGDQHEIGAFKLVIDERVTGVRFYNLTRKVQGYEAGMNGPHLFSDGRPCLGNMDAVIPQLVANYEWSALVQICIAFVETVNVADAAGGHIRKWPVSMTRAQIEEEKERERKSAIQEVTESSNGRIAESADVSS